MTTETPERWSRLRAAVAFVMIGFLTLFVGTSVMVGAFDFEPRRAALIAAGLAAVLGVLGGSFGPTRRFFAGLVINFMHK